MTLLKRNRKEACRCGPQRGGDALRWNIHSSDGRKWPKRCRRRAYPCPRPASVICGSKHGLETTFKRLEAIARSGHRGATLTDGQRAIVRRGMAAPQGFAGKAGAPGVDARGGTAVERRALIVAAAAELFVERGYAGTSMREIAGRGRPAGGVGLPLLSGKEEPLSRGAEGRVPADHRACRTRASRAASIHGGGSELACAEHVHSVVAGNAILRVTGTGLFAIHEDARAACCSPDRDRYEAIFRKLIRALDLPRGVDRSLFRLALLRRASAGRASGTGLEASRPLQLPTTS